MSNITKKLERDRPKLPSLVERSSCTSNGSSPREEGRRGGMEGCPCDPHLSSTVHTNQRTDLMKKVSSVVDVSQPIRKKRKKASSVVDVSRRRDISNSSVEATWREADQEEGEDEGELCS